MKKHLKHLRNEQGLTLVELLAVVVILAVVAVIGFVMIGKVIENSKQDAHISQAIQMVEAAKLQALTTEPTEAEVTAKEQKFQFVDLQDEEFRDPWTKNPYTPTDAEVIKNLETGVYTVSNFESADYEASKKGCFIGETTAVSEDTLLKKQNRKAICGH